MERTGRREVAISRERPPPSEGRVIGMGQAGAGRASVNRCRSMAEPRASRARAVGRGMECRSAGMTDMGGHMRTQACAATDPAAGNTRAAHMHGAAAHAHTAAAKMNAATPATEVSTATATTEVTAAPTAAAEMSTTTPAAAAASRISNSRQTKRKAYCGRTCHNFPHDMTS
jgi:hypothetical protein